ncbi:MAG: prepilin-type N-terminal cleavage/methylation domain-containing protein [Candidatus Saccharimonadales bacterium]
MIRHEGFTVIELLLTITIMVVLTTVAVVALNRTQANGRDEERRSDVDVISRSLEQFYNSNSSTGTYIGTSSATVANLANLIPNLGQDALHAPDVSTTDPISLLPATNANQTITGVLPQPTTTTYVYQPLQYDAATSSFVLCTDHVTAECRKFNLYYRLEKTNEIIMVTSKQQ